MTEARDDSTVDGLRAQEASRAAESIGLTPLLEAALDAFADGGYHGTSVRDIAERAGVTPPVLYYHHQNKHGVLEALLNHSIDHLVSACEEAVDAPHDSVSSEFKDLIRAITTFMIDAGKLAQLNTEVRFLTPSARTTYSGKRRRVARILTECIERGNKSGELDASYPRESARALLGMIQAIPRWLQPTGSLTTEEIANRYLEISCKLVGLRT